MRTGMFVHDELNIGVLVLCQLGRNGVKIVARLGLGVAVDNFLHHRVGILALVSRLVLFVLLLDRLHR